MDTVCEVISLDSDSKQLAIQIGHADRFFWVERFVENSSVALSRAALQTLNDALNVNAEWSRNHNDIVARYDSNQRVIIARHELDDICTLPASSIPVADFIRIMVAWEQERALADDAQSIDEKQPRQGDSGT